MLNIKDYDVVIGSFQKDGIGWSEDFSPKYVRGSDVFCDVVELIAKKYPVFVLLTGPAREYVKSRLTNSNIRFHHECFDDPNKSSENYYGARVSKGLNEPDIHGTVMFIWGLSLISRLLDINDKTGLRPFST